MFQTFKYIITRIGVAFFLLISLGFIALYFLHEIALPDTRFNDDVAQWALVLISLFLGFVVYGFLGERRFDQNYKELGNIGAKNNPDKIIKHFEALIRFTGSSYFLPAKGRRLRAKALLRYADYLLSVGKNDSGALKVYLKAFLQDPANSKFRAPLLSLLKQGGEMSDRETDLLVVMLKTEDYRDQYITNYLAQTFLKKREFSTKSEPIFLKVVENHRPGKEKITQFVIPILLAKKRSDERAVRFYLGAMESHFPEEDLARKIVARSFCEGKFQGVDSDLHKKCGEVFAEMDELRRENLKRTVDESFVAGKWKKVKILTREDKEDLQRLKVRLGITPSTSGYIKSAILWVFRVLGGGVKNAAMKMLDGLDVFGAFNLRTKLSTVAVLIIFIGAGWGGYRYWQENFKEIEVAQAPAAKIEKKAVYTPPPGSPPRAMESAHTIQVAAVTTLKKAGQFINGLKKNGVEGAYSVKIKRSLGGNWFKIRVGKFEDKSQAASFGDQLIGRRIIQNYFIISFAPKNPVPKKPIAVKKTEPTLESDRESGMEPGLKPSNT